MPKVTLHQGRGMVKGKHNDAKREWLKDVKDTDVLARYDASKTKENKQWTAEHGESYEANFDEDIKKTYKELYEPGLKEQNERYKKSGHSERQKTIDEWYHSKKYAPTEMILQYGNSEDKTNHRLTNEEFWKCSLKMKDYIEEHYPNVKVLGVAAHFDETSPHSHLSYTVEYNGKPNLNKGLEQSGVQLPNKGEKVGRYNHRGMTFTEELRCQFEEIIKEYDIELTPHDKDTHTTTQSLTEYRARKKAENIIDNAQQEAQYSQDVKEELDAKIVDINSKLQGKNQEYKDLEGKIINFNKEHKDKIDLLADLDNQLSVKQDELEKNLDEEVNKKLMEELKGCGSIKNLIEIVKPVFGAPYYKINEENMEKVDKIIKYEKWCLEKYDSKVEELRETRREAEQEKKAYKDRREKFDSVLEIHQKNSSVRGEYIIDRINMLSNIANKDVYKLSETEMKEIQEIYYDTANLKLHKEEIHGKRINYKALESAYDQVITRMELEGGKEQEIEWMEYLQRFGQEDGLVL